MKVINNRDAFPDLENLPADRGRPGAVLVIGEAGATRRVHTLFTFDSGEPLRYVGDDGVLHSRAITREGSDISDDTGARRDLWRAGVLAVAMATMTALVTACGGGGSSTAGNLAAYQKALAYARCMRSHGEPDWPDPNHQGRFAATGIDRFSPNYQRASNACGYLLPTSGGHISAVQQQQAIERGLKMAACMRSHGIPDFPDPTVPQGGGLEIKLPNDIDPYSPQFKAAQQACQKFLPHGGRGIRHR